jgi:phosphoribosylaminoimidazole (AIR) synthetase
MERVGLTRVVGKKYMLLKVVGIVDCIVVEVIVIVVDDVVVVVVVVMLLLLWLCCVQKKEWSAQEICSAHHKPSTKDAIIYGVLCKFIQVFATLERVALFHDGEEEMK